MAELQSTSELRNQAQPEHEASSRSRPVLHRFMQNKLAVAGMVVIVFMYAVAIAAPVIQRYDYREITPGARNLPPSSEHWLGTDRNGRDTYSRLVYGSRVSLAVGFVAVAIVMTIGTSFGALAGYFGGWVDGILMRFTDVLLSIPQILLLIAAAALFRPSLKTTVIVIGVTSWPGAARLIRGQFLSLRDQEYVTAARTIGAPPFRIIMRHLMPNAMAIIIVETTLWLSYAILLEASLSYLGLGVQIPTPSWGNMLQDGQRELLVGAWWLTFFPGLAIFMTALAFNLVGDGLRDAFDPRQRRR
ncbi:MAG: ABC transporter permease [Thermomicrobiales bacterium]|nr:ABC transporter permease [Thermomicrobiales bacterium]